MTENGISILGVKRRTYKPKRSFTLCIMFIRKHTVNTGDKKAEGKKAGVKGRGVKRRVTSPSVPRLYHVLPSSSNTVSRAPL